MSNDNSDNSEPEPGSEPGLDVDAQFADIMSRWETTAPDPTRAAGSTDPAITKGVNPAPRIRRNAADSEEDDDQRTPEAGADIVGAAGTAEVATPPSDAVEHPVIGVDGSGWRSYDVEDDDHFVPPAPRPLPAGDIQFWAILIGLVGGPALLLYLTIFNQDTGGFWLIVAVIMSVVGFGMLVARLPQRHDDTDGDDGARV